MRDEVGVAVERGAGGQTIGVCPTIVSCPQVERDHVARRETIRGVTSGLTPRVPYELPSTVTRHPRNLKETDRLVTLVTVKMVTVSLVVVLGTRYTRVERTRCANHTSLHTRVQLLLLQSDTTMCSHHWARARGVTRSWQ